ncbi:DUF87 domain-containing protein (plasmid) [Pontibacillus sp. ALD_SL1]|uniref:helicase HerA domain-containing protein n=1 Tax=Pontibacillus sp. ALD_SL1 TaxID=2777185 RepID=UPI001A95CC93|nr:DUF87 domain-containing protein [Pontibacillus sp. ALD_SL1]QST02996.1 DUF87 domain-containing protein [Pontibacillus sp. ALD_SL1]
MLKKFSNPFRVVDKGTTHKKTIVSGDLDHIENQEIEPVYKKNGTLDYILFKHKQNRREWIRTLHLFRVASVSNEVRDKTSNEEAFKNILNDFRRDGSSLVVLYAYKPGENIIIGYGILQEGPLNKREQMVKEGRRSVNVLETQFRSAYNNIEIVPLTYDESWVIDSIYYEHMTMARGIPKADSSLGSRVGTNYSNAPKIGRQVSEILLKGMTAKTVNGQIEGYGFLFLTVFDPLPKEEIRRGISLLQNELGKADSSSQMGESENENFSFPLLFGYGFGEMFGQSEVDTIGASETETVSQGESQTRTVGTSEMNSEGMSQQTSQGTSLTNTDSSSKSEGNGGNVGASLIVQDTWNWTEGNTEGQSIAEGQSNSISQGMTETNSEGRSESNATGVTTSQSSAQGTTTSQAVGESQSQGNNQSAAGGVNMGDGAGISRQIKDHYQAFLAEILKINEVRYQSSLRDGMFDCRMMVLTEDEEAKLAAEELIKQAYMDKEAPLPIRICTFKSKEEERLMKRYVKGLVKPKALDGRNVVPERYRFSTYVTPFEATAFNLPQDNLHGYISSFDPIPPTMAYVGKMQEGAILGKQWDRNLNLQGKHNFTLTKDQLRGHIGIFGGTGTGKTVFTQRFISELHNKFDMNFLLMDWTKNHRALINQVKNPKKFRFNSFDPNLMPLHVNLVRTPQGVSDYKWNSVFAELLCFSMGLGDRSLRIITKVMKLTKEKAREGNYEPTMKHFIEEIAVLFLSRMSQHAGDRGDRSISAQIRNQMRFMPSNEQQSFGSLIERMEEWMDEEHPAFMTMCKGPFMPIEDLVRGDFVHLIEGAEIPKEIRPFVINGLAAGIFEYCAARDEKLKKPTYLIFEEAQAVLQEPTGNEPLNINETIFETMSREARNYNLFIGYVCQSPETLPPLIFDNMPIRVVFQLSSETAKSKIVSAGGRDPNRLDVDLVKWLSMKPRGMCLIRLSNFDRIQEGQFVAVKTIMNHTETMTNNFFKTLYYKKTK